MILEKIKNFRIILGSQSPRRSELLKSLDVDFEILVKSIDESIPSNVLPTEAAEFLALKKLDAFSSAEFSDALIITSDTVVVDQLNRPLGKPTDAEEAKIILRSLSGNKHVVYTGVAILCNGIKRSFTCSTQVHFSILSVDEIDYYIERYKPYDKAGSYGIQEWIGRIAVERIEGSYENVMGLPTARLYRELKEIEKGL